MVASSHAIDGLVSVLDKPRDLRGMPAYSNSTHTLCVLYLLVCDFYARIDSYHATYSFCVPVLRHPLHVGDFTGASSWRR